MLYIFAFCLLITTQIYFVVSDETQDVKANISKLKLKADTLFTTNKLDEASKVWESVIALEPENDQNYYKRFRIFLKMQKYKEAISDLTASLKINPNQETVLAQRAKLNMRYGRCKEAEVDFLNLKKLNKNNKDVDLISHATSCARSINEAEKFYKKNDYQQAIRFYSDAILHADVSPDLLYHRALSYAYISSFQKVISDTGKILKFEPNSIDALELRGRAYYSLKELEMAGNHYRQALKFDPEHKSTKDAYRLLKKINDGLKKAKKAHLANKFQDEVNHLLKLLDVDPNHSYLIFSLYINIGYSYYKSKKYSESITYLQKANALWPGSQYVNYILGKNYLDDDSSTEEEFEKAVQHFNKAIELNNQNEEENELKNSFSPFYIELNLNKNLLHDLSNQAQAALKRSKQKDYYKILGIQRSASVKIIKKAYREMALKWHPDKHVEGEKVKAEKQFQLIAEAYEILSDKEKKMMYDRGEDPLNPNQQQQHHGGNPFGFHFQQGHHGHQGHRFHRQHTGGFHFQF